MSEPLSKVSSGPAIWGIIPAAGVGSRVGGSLPKQYLPLAGKTLLEHAADALLATPGLRGLVIALNPQDTVFERLPLAKDSRVTQVEGGAERADSVLAGLNVLQGEANDSDWVLVHDAARPCLQQSAVTRLLAEVKEDAVGGILARPVSETVKRAAQSHHIADTLPRQQLWLAQTPQMFPYGLLRQSLLQAREEGFVVTDEAMALERQGYRPLLVEGDSSNIKVTYAQDLKLAGWYLRQREEAGCG